MRAYVGIDMAKDKFDYCTVDDDMNILYRGNNCSNSSESFDSLKNVNAKRIFLKNAKIKIPKNAN